MSMVYENQLLSAGAAGGQLPAGIAGEKEKTNQGGWFYFTLKPNQGTTVKFHGERFLYVNWLISASIPAGSYSHAAAKKISVERSC